ncbi:MAG: type II toxin-antitoxin system Phd/YefM family antitoxin [Thermaceae bacterium]|nr:type II toxin-antitoxin system Phd/YefM family antitoxin [Thermaceae bacterium]
MPRVQLDLDIRPISEFREKAAAFVEQVHQTKRPLVITQHGRSAAVLLDISEYERLMQRLDKLEIIGAVEEGIKDVEAGRVTSHAEAKEQLLKKFKV